MKTKVIINLLFGHPLVHIRSQKTLISLSFDSLSYLWPRDKGKLLYPYLPNLSAREGYDTRSIFKLSLTGLNSEFSFS